MIRKKEEIFPSLIEIDGSYGEGGGQILRSALSLSIITGSPFRIRNIRAKRPSPGLKPQHLKSVHAAAAISQATVEGATKNSTSLIFIPSAIRTGRYKFDIGTAGSTSLVLQTIFLPLSMAKSASHVIITGGTHVPWSPCFHYLEYNWLPVLHQLGFNANLKLELAGFYPQGGGRISATIRPFTSKSNLKLIQRGKLIRIYGMSGVANLDINIAKRQKRQVLKRLNGIIEKDPSTEVKIKIDQLPSNFKGTLLLLVAEFEYSQCCYYALGEIGKPAEQVADEAVDALLQFLDSKGVVDSHLADQLILPAALLKGESIIYTNELTPHMMTNANVIQTFLPTQIEFIEKSTAQWTIKIVRK